MTDPELQSQIKELRDQLRKTQRVLTWLIIAFVAFVLVTWLVPMLIGLASAWLPLLIVIALGAAIWWYLSRADQSATESGMDEES